jgi:hypothetical protein
MIALFSRRSMPVMFRRSALAALCLTALVSGAWTLRGAAQQPGSAPSARELAPSLHARTPRRLVIRNAMVIYGNARPPYSPVDVIVENGTISYGTDVMVVNGKTVSNETAVGASGRGRPRRRQ